MKIKVGVIFGGESVEHEVSIISALQAINNIDKNKYIVVPIYISKDKVWYTGKDLCDISIYNDLDKVKKNSKSVSLCKVGNEYYLIQTKGLLNKIVDKIDIAFPIVHGQNVEDGSLAGYLETVGIPYVGPNVLGASLGQDKVVMKQVFESSNIPVVDYVWFYESDYINDEEKYLRDIKKLEYPVLVKPASLGSSVGINFVKNENEIKDAINEAFTYDDKIVVEKAVENLIEVNCSVLGDKNMQSTSVIEQVLSNNQILTYEDKYIGDSKKSGVKSKGMASTNRIIPARINKELAHSVSNISKDVFKVLNLSGVCRIDFLINSKTSDVFVNEPNTIPGSLSYYLWEKSNIKYSELLDRLISISIKNYKDRRKKVFSFDTNILKNYNKNSGFKK